MFWTIGQFPELDHLERRQRAVILASVPLWTYPVILVSSLIGGLIAGSILATLLVWAGLKLPVAGIVAVPLVALIAVAMYALQISRLRVAMRQTIADAFQDDRPPFCFECGYDLRASKDEKCPECGQIVGSPS
jgi:hypothetical protein